MGKFLIVFGAIVALISGGCTLAVLSDTTFNDPFIGLVFLIGGVPFVVGIGILLIGVAVNKHVQKRATESEH
jgi:hypothetical protein